LLSYLKFFSLLKLSDDPVIESELLEKDVVTLNPNSTNLMNETERNCVGRYNCTVSNKDYKQI